MTLLKNKIIKLKFKIILKMFCTIIILRESKYCEKRDCKTVQWLLHKHEDLRGYPQHPCANDKSSHAWE